MRCRCRVSASISLDTNTGGTAFGATTGVIAFDTAFWINFGKTRKLCWKRVVRWSRDAPMKRGVALRRTETWLVVRTEFKARGMTFLNSSAKMISEDVTVECADEVR